MVTIYGIKNCDTMKKAMRWLDEHDVEYTFHDVRKQGLTAKQIQTWEKEIGWETLLNRRGQLWRKVPEAEREKINKQAAIKLMQDDAGIIKRPVLDLGNKRVVGFNADEYAELFA
jgi:arsenate reductase